MIGLSPFITAYILIFVFIIGMCMGSFFNAYAYRICNGGSIVRGHSKCTSCGHQLYARDLVPLFSWLFLKGRCRYCGEKISARYPIAELICGISFALVVLNFDVSGTALKFLFFISILFLMAMVDIESSIIPDRFILAGLIGYIPLCLISEEALKPVLISGLIGAVAAAVPILLLSIVFDKILKRDTMGGGDIKLFFVCGLYLGIKCVLPLILFSCISGILFFIIGRGRYTVSEEENGKGAFPFGPGIALGAFVTLFIGEKLMSMYLSMF